jgi:hypothetical protein
MMMILALLSLSAATIGLIAPLNFPGFVCPSTYWINKLLRWSSAMLLALHHVNSRDACIVGNETLSRIPETFKISFKLKNNDWSSSGAAEALTSWTTMHRFLDDSCGLLKQHNLTVGSTAGLTTEIRNQCKKVDAASKCASTATALYEASYSDDIHAVVGLPSSHSSKIVTDIANLHKLPVMSFGARDSVLTMGSYPRFSRLNVRSGPMVQAIVGFVKHFGWRTINVLHVGTQRALDFALELTAVASAGGVTVASTHVYNSGGEDLDSIAQAVTALSKFMYNASSLSRTRVTVLFAESIENLAQVCLNPIPQTPKLNPKP